MIALVTGATGFIGTALVRRLIAEQHEVRCLSRSSTPTPGAHSFQVDFARTNLGLSDQVFENVDVVFHLAAATRAQSVEAFFDANVHRTRLLIDRIAGTTARPRFLLVSSQAASGPTSPRAAHHLADSTPVRVESDPPSPVGAYGVSKLAAEDVVRDHAREMPWTIVRPCSVYGPGDRDFLTIFSMANRGVAIYAGNRRSVVSTIFIDDLVGGLIAAANSPTSVAKTYFLAADGRVTWEDIYRTAASVMHRPFRAEIEVPIELVRVAGIAGDLLGRLTGRVPLVNSDKAALAAPRYWTVSSDLARADFGFAAPTSLRDGLGATYSWYVNKGWL